MNSFLLNKINFLRKLNLVQKFLLTYFVLILLPLTILFGYTYTKMSLIIKDNILNSTKQAFDQSTDFLTYKLYRIFDISNSLAIDQNITDILRKDPDNYPLSDQIGHLKYLRQFLSSFEDESDVSNICLFVNDGFIYSNDNKNIFSINSLENSKCIEMINSTNARFLWGPSSYFDLVKDENDLNYISLFKTIKNPDNFSEDIGYLKLNLNKAMIEEIISKINSIPNSVSYVVNSDGIVICSSNNNNSLNYINNISLIQSYSEINNNFTESYFNNKKIYIKSSLIDKTDWYLVTILPQSSIMTKINAQRACLFLIVALCGGTAIILAIYFVNSINKRLSKVIDGMRSVQAGNLNNYIENYSDDELGELIDNYNYMIGKMSILINEQYKLGKDVKNAELKALQSQINPHFLYNTLDMINWMSYKNMNSEISIAVKNLAKFYKLSLSKGKNLISIKDEIQHASLYVSIQNMRYNNRISLRINIDDEINDFLIPKITLQPILENAINHGILGKGECNGTISILGYIVNDYIVLKVSDDGIGIKEDTINLLLSSKLTSSKGSGYGLKNINKRIQLLYGDIYGLTFKSTYGCGTTVEIKLPKVKQQ